MEDISLMKNTYSYATVINEGTEKTFRSASESDLKLLTP